MNAELKAAAERLNNSRKSQTDYQGITVDYVAVGEWALPLLSDEPVTAEWLRETWGWKNHGADASFGVLWWWRWGELCIGGAKFNGITTQGQFTLLALGLGLTPKEGD